MTELLSKTPLYKNHLALGARMVPFAGYEMPVQYQGVLEETKACRKTGGIFDVSHMGQFSLRGKQVLSELQRLVTNQLSKMALGQAQYNFLCKETGGVLDDIIVYHRAVDELFLCVNASNRKTDWEWLTSHLSKNVLMEDRSDETALIAIQGPQAETLLTKLAPNGEWEKLNYYWAKEAQLCGFPVFVSRTGYTGEDGFELYADSNHAPQLWDTLLSEGCSLGIVPCGLGARDSLRLEMGYPLHGHELSPDITPLQAGLNWAVKLDTVNHFMGREALLSERQMGSRIQLKAFIIQDKRIARQGYEIATLDKVPVGTITSGTFSPHLNTPIALGFVDKTAVQHPNYLIKVRQEWIPAVPASLPFVPSHVKKRKES